MVTKNTQRLAEVRPTGPRAGFPVWYERSTGRDVKLVLAPRNGSAPVATDPEESGPLHPIARFPREASYMSAESHLRTEPGQDEAGSLEILVLEAGSSGEREQHANRQRRRPTAAAAPPLIGTALTRSTDARGTS